MGEKKLNGWSAKLKRTVTSVLPVDRNRSGFCTNCGDCCRLPVTCMFLDHKPNGESFCKIHPIRPLNCRKYPRAESEFLTAKNCGFFFKENS